MKIPMYILLTCIIIMGCQNPEHDNGTIDYRKEMLGKWESTSFDVTRPTVNGSDSTAYAKVSPENYTEKTGLKTTIVEYYPDGRYKEEYISASGEVAYMQSGYWMIVEDSIILAIYHPITSQAVQRYKIQLDGNEGTFYALMDYDGDGEEDDTFIGVSRKIE